MFSSVDGKISTGDTDILDTDTDLRRIMGVREGLQQYYDLEKQTDLHSLNSGEVMAKIGMNIKKDNIERTPVSFIIIDNKPHLNEVGVDNLLQKSKKLYIVTTNKNHPALERQDEDNLEIIYYPNEIDFEDLFKQFKEKYNIDRITIQTGGTLNAIFLRKKLIDHISFVFAPVLVGGKDTPSLIDGESLHSAQDLINIKALKLKECRVLENSYIHLFYDVINDTIIE